MILKLCPGSCRPNPCTPCQRTRSPPSAGRCCRPQHPDRSLFPKHPQHPNSSKIPNIPPIPIVLDIPNIPTIPIVLDIPNTLKIPIVLPNILTIQSFSLSRLSSLITYNTISSSRRPRSSTWFWTTLILTITNLFLLQGGRHHPHDSEQLGPSSGSVSTGACHLWWQWSGGSQVTLVSVKV